MGEEQQSLIAESESIGGAAKADAGGAALAIVARLDDIDGALRPILGGRAVSALYMRSIHLVLPTHPWLIENFREAGPTIDTAALQETLSAQTPADAAAAGEALLQTFHQLLISLIGVSLTDRLLLPIRETTSGRAPPQETPP